MREIKLPFGKAADGRMVSVDAVVRGLDCDCVCPSCGADLVAAKGEIYQHHFRHYTDRADCIAARETAIHQFAKQIILEKLQLALPDPLGVMVKATAECRLGDIIPDVLAEYDSGETLAVEIWVAHQVPVHKVRTYNQLRQAAVEIDLRAYRLTEKSEVRMGGRDPVRRRSFMAIATRSHPPGARTTAQAVAGGAAEAVQDARRADARGRARARCSSRHAEGRNGSRSG